MTLGSREVDVHGPHSEAGWRGTLAETGERPRTGDRMVFP